MDRADRKIEARFVSLLFFGKPLLLLRLDGQLG